MLLLFVWLIVTWCFRLGFGLGWFIWCCGVLLVVLWFGNCWRLVDFVGLPFGL